MAEFDQQDELTPVIAQITAAVTNTGLYTFSHPQVAGYIEKAHQALEGLLRSRPQVTLMIIGSDLVAENRPFPSDSAFAANFIRLLRKKGIERLTFSSGLPKTELRDFIRGLAASEATAMRSTSFITLGRVELRVKETGAPAPEQQLAEAPPEVLQELINLTATELDELKDIYLRVKKNRQIDVRGVDEIVKRFVGGFRQEINPLKLLASIKTAHEYTFTHVVNVGILSMSQAEALGFTGEQLHQVGVASLLHDVGKLFIPEEILSKPGRLSDDERKVIETHTTKGARYLMGLDGIPKLAVLAALEHHLKFNGAGYPAIKGGWTPNIASQIIAIADVFDAMRSRRSYSEPHPVEKIAEVLRNGSGTSFNPQLVDRFLKLIGQ